MPTSGVVRGGQWAGSGANIVTGSQWAGSGTDVVAGSQWSGVHTEPPASRGITARGVATAGGPTPGVQTGPPDAASWGGQLDGPVTDSVDSLLDVEGFALVLNAPQGKKRIVFSPDQPAYRDIKSVGWTTEVNKMASWQATVPLQPEVYQWNFANAIIGYDGERRFHGVMLSSDPSEIRSGEVTLSGYGPLYWGGHDDITVRYSDTSAWMALEDVWLEVAKATDGRVRGEVVRPRHEHVEDHIIPEAGIEWSGTPSEVLQQAHGYAGMAFSFDHSDPAAVATSFVPGEELRDVAWTPTSVKPAINTEGYHNQATVIGAPKAAAAEPITNGERYSATVTAPQNEVESVMGGRIHNRTERESDLESREACRARASTLLAEDRGEYTIGGSLDVTPGARQVVPGYTYRIEPFDKYAPAAFSPVWASLRQVQHSYGPGEASVTLSFDDESRLVEHIRQDLVPENAPRSIDRRDNQLNQGNPNYDAPADVTYAAGDGIAGSGHAGAAGEDSQ
jgi:hypothetical protein